MIRQLLVTAILIVTFFCVSSFAKDSITTTSIIATHTEQDCRMLTAMQQRGASFDEVDALCTQVNCYVIAPRTTIVVDRVEEGGVLIHIKGASDMLWISNNALGAGCIPVDD